MGKCDDGMTEPTTDETVLESFANMLADLPQALAHTGCVVANFDEQVTKGNVGALEGIAREFAAGMRGERGGLMADLLRDPPSDHAVAASFRTAPFPEHKVNKADTGRADR